MDKDKLIYCGHGIYADIDTGSVFEKKAEELVEIEDDEILAEKRFIEKHLKVGGEDREK